MSPVVEVIEPVLAQTAGNAKTLAAYVTHVRLRTGVHVYVAEKMWTRKEMSTTDRAHVNNGALGRCVGLKDAVAFIRGLY